MLVKIDGSLHYIPFHFTISSLICGPNLDEDPSQATTGIPLIPTIQNIGQVDKLETDKMLISMVEIGLEERKMDGAFNDQFNRFVCNFFFSGRIHHGYVH